MIEKMKKSDYEIGIAFRAPEDEQFFKLETALFNITRAQLLNSIALMVYDYVRATHSRLSFVECKNFTTGEDIDLSDIYPAPVRKGNIGGKHGRVN